jgi:hypothetical protein
MEEGSSDKKCWWTIESEEVDVCDCRQQEGYRIVEGGGE